MTSPEKARGSAWERTVAKYFNERGFLRVERRYGAGNTLDKGDLNGLRDVVIECKAVKAINLADIMNETLRERENAKAKYGVAVIKRRNRGVDQAYVMMTLENFCTLLHETPHLW